MPESLIQQTLDSILQDHLSTQEWRWFEEQLVKQEVELMTSFVATPRFVQRKPIHPSSEQSLQLANSITGFSVEGWDSVRLVRVALLTRFDSSDETHYIDQITTLFDTAEMNELVALYSALPLLAYPQQWLFRATDAVRSNIGFVLDAIALQNPYPATYFSEAAWNQLVLKAIFNDKPIHLIIGLEARTNEKLAVTLSDFAHERWAAGRSVAPQVWRLIVPFVNDSFTEDLKQLFTSDKPFNKAAAALVCFHTDFAEAKALLADYPELNAQIATGSLSWSNLEFDEINTYQS